MEKLLLIVDIDCKPNECWQCRFLGVEGREGAYICRAYNITLKERKTKTSCLAIRCKQCKKNTIKKETNHE